MHNTHSSKNPGLCSFSFTSVPLTLQNPLSYLWIFLKNIKDCFIPRTKAFKQDLLQTKLLNSCKYRPQLFEFQPFYTLRNVYMYIENTPVKELCLIFILPLFFFTNKFAYYALFPFSLMRQLMLSKSLKLGKSLHCFHC